MPRAVVEGVGLEYRLEGTGPQTVVLLNGIAMSIAHWKPLAARLVEAGYRVLMHDFRGQLLSERPAPPYSFEQHAQDLAGLLSQLDIGAAHIVGTSYGAEVALTFARDFPQRCLSVVSIDGASEYDAVLGAAVESWKAAALSDPRVFYRAIKPWNYSAAYLQANGAALDAREAAIVSLPRDWFESFAGLCDAFLAIDLTKDLGRIHCPCLVIVAGADILKGPAYAHIIQQGVAGAQYAEIPGAGHAVVIEQPEAVADALIPFAGGVSGVREEIMDGETVTVLGRKMYYVENGAGAPIVLVHGNTGSSAWWSLVMDMPGHRVIAPDLPNFGRSEPLDIADIDVYADHLAAFISALGLDAPVVVGHSLGGAVVMSMAARRPELARAIVLVDGAAPAGLKTPEEHYPYIELFKTNRDMMRQALAAVAPTMKNDTLLDRLTDDAMKMAPLAFAGNARALERFNYVGKAGAFKGPVLVVWGRKDSIITEAMANQTAAAYQNARLQVIDTVGHSVMVEDPERFRRLLAEFLK